MTSCSFETSVLYKATQRRIPEDKILDIARQVTEPRSQPFYKRSEEYNFIAPTRKIQLKYSTNWDIIAAALLDPVS
jgi:hypothetical protein